MNIKNNSSPRFPSSSSSPSSSSALSSQNPAPIPPTPSTHASHLKLLWTDGSASPNPGPGGFTVLENGAPVYLGAENPSTNIRMEGMALIAAMRYAAGAPCKIHTDSEFWVNVLVKWAPLWAAKNWTKSKGEIKNLDLVQQAYALYQQGNVELVWVRGHAGNKYNELADYWANRARRGDTLTS